MEATSEFGTHAFNGSMCNSHALSLAGPVCRRLEEGMPSVIYRLYILPKPEHINKFVIFSFSFFFSLGMSQSLQYRSNRRKTEKKVRHASYL